jgi:type VI secretion system protein ImpK
MANDGDKTVIIPTPGRKSAAGVTDNARPVQASAPNPATSSGTSSVNPAMSAATGVVVKQSLNKLVGAATELTVLIGELRHTVQHADLARLRNSLIDQIRKFEADARQQGQPSEVVLSARYVLCACLDEAVLNTPWGPESGWAQHSLLSTFHNETAGGEKVFLILDRLLQTPAQYIDILELIYLCLAQGFSGKYQIDPRGHLQLERIRENLYRAIEMQRGGYERQLSPRWKGVQTGKQKVSEFVPLWVVFSIAFSLLVFSYTGFRYWLDHTTTPVAEELDAITLDYNKRVNSP